jgi:hypothetical protein
MRNAASTTAKDLSPGFLFARWPQRHDLVSLRTYSRVNQHTLQS